MRVEIVNKEELKDLFRLWGKTSAICYNTPEKYAVGVGKSCLNTEHFSGSRHRYIVIKFSDISRACADQLARHSVGTAVNMKSFRYCSLEDFKYHIPSRIKNNEKAYKLYIETMESIQKSYNGICEALIESGLKGEQVFECARGIAPMNTYTELVMGFTIEALINMLNKRLCVCSQEEIRQVAKLVKEAVEVEIPELAPRLVAVCEEKLYCPESAKRSCGRFPQKEVLKTLLKEARAKKIE